MERRPEIIQWGSNRKALVFLHYFGGSALSWQWVGENLADSFKCIAISFPGFGKSPAIKKPSIQNFSRWIQEELDVLGIDSCTLIGHSMGGKIAMQMAALKPANYEQLILIAPSPPTTEPMPEKEKERMLIHPSLSEAEKTVAHAIRQKLSADCYELAIHTQLEADPVSWRWWLTEGMGHSIADQVKSLRLPITVLSSEDDPVMTPEVIEQRVLRVLQRSKSVTTRNVGHLIPMEDPDWVAEQIRTITGAEHNK